MKDIFMIGKINPIKGGKSDLPFSIPRTLEVTLIGMPFDTYPAAMEDIAQRPPGLYQIQKFVEHGRLFHVGQQVWAENVLPLPLDWKNDKIKSKHAPPLEYGKEYTVEKIYLDRKGFQHLHVGIKSQLNFIRSIETGEEIPDGDKYHWCHPCRFSTTPI